MRRLAGSLPEWRRRTPVAWHARCLSLVGSGGSRLHAPLSWMRPCCHTYILAITCSMCEETMFAPARAAPLYQ